MRYLDKFSGQDKYLRSLERERERLWQAQGRAPIIPLERPYQRGWVKSYVLEERISQRPDAAVFRRVLNEINQRVYSRDRSFVDRNDKGIVLRPRIIPVREWLKLAWPTSHQRFFGYGNWRLDEGVWTPLNWRRQVLGFKLIHAAWLREDVQPHLITHQRVDLPAVRSRLAEIEAIMMSTQGCHRLDWLHGRSRWWRRMTASTAELRSRDAFHAQLADSLPD
jgi:hypothetical protein